MDERTGELLENYSQGLSDVEVLLTPPRELVETYEEDFEWPLSDGETDSKKRKYCKKEAVEDIQPMVSKKLKKQKCPPQPSSQVKASQPKCNESENFYILKSELDKELNLKPDAHLWRRDGDELQQKYRLSDSDGSETQERPEIFFSPTPVYGIWDEHRRNEYHAVEVKHAESGSDCKVQLVGIVVEQESEENQSVIEFEDSLISYDDGSFDGPLDDNCIIIEEIFVNEA